MDRQAVRPSAAIAVRCAAFVATVAFVAQFAILDVALAGGRLRPGWPMRDAESVVLWSLALVLARTRVRRVVIAVAAAIIVVTQLQVFLYYHVPLDVQVAASALHAWSDVSRFLTRAWPRVALGIALACALEHGLLSLARRLVEGRRVHVHPLLLGVPAFIGLLVLSPREATPDVRAAHALTALRYGHEPPPAGAASLPPLHVARARLPSVLVILGESTRADDYTAEATPETTAATRGRVDLRELRSVASYTAVSLSAVVSGREQNAPRAEILGSPSLFDYARAARSDNGVRARVAYIASQYGTIFETPGVAAATDVFVAMEQFEPRRNEPTALGSYGDDRFAVEYLEKHLDALPSPSVVFLHLNDTHVPYVVDPDRTPFQPYDHDVSFSQLPKLHNAYRNAIVLQDRAVARAIRAFVDHQQGAPYLVLFTSDHGEAFGEHGAIHHGQNLLDEQVHVPGWVLAGNGALTPAQQNALADHTARFVTHLDILPTVLDVMGLWDNFAIAKYRAAMPGKSLIRAFEARRPIPVTNCTTMFPCPTNTWGYYDGDRKLLSRIFDTGWVCLAMDGGPERLAEWDPRCEALRRETLTTFPELPNGQPNRP